MRMIELSKRQVTLVDDEDYDWLSGFNWHAKKKRSDNGKEFYAALTTHKTGRYHTVYMHRLIMRCPTDKVVHHRNGDTLDNRKANLEIVTTTENHKHQKRRPKC